MPESPTVIKGFCTVCGITIYATDYFIMVPTIPDRSEAITAKELEGPTHMTYHQEKRTRYSLEPGGIALLACPQCGAFF
jgi:hypothetical protein